MASVTASIGGGVNVVATMTSTGIQYVINLANGSSAGPYTGDQLVNVGSQTITIPPPEQFILTYNGQTVATSTNPADIENGGDIVLNTFQIQQYAEQQLAVAPNTTAADAPVGTDENVPGAGSTPTNTSPTTITSQNDPYLGDATNQPYDDNGNLNPGWQIDEATGKPFYVGDLPANSNTVVSNADPAATTANVGAADASASNQAVAQNDSAQANNNTNQTALTGPLLNTQSQATQQDAANFAQLGDWRVRLALAPSATYLYKNKGNEGILLPLAATDGVIFPYTPAISVQYAANYDATELTHSNYKFFQYKNSAVDSISITCDFTAQDTQEANYVLAVIHFFRSVTKMFYGQDLNPNNGTPPPLCYLYGLGQFQFDSHPLAITAFNYSLPTDVDYIRAGAATTAPGVNLASMNVATQNSSSVSGDRLNSSGLNPGATTGSPQFATSDGTRTPTYVPTKIQMSITAIPIVTRNDISNNFSLNGPGPNYGSGALLQGSKRQGGGIW